MSKNEGSVLERAVVLGAGTVGRALSEALVARNLRPVVVSRSATELPGTDARRADVSDPAQAVAATAGATVVFTTVQPEYHRWAEEFPALQASIVDACVANDVPLIVLDNLYGYGHQSGSLREDTPLSATTKKGRVRAGMWQALQQAAAERGLQMGVLRASDFFGPGVEGSAYGERFVGHLKKGKPAEIVGDPDARHAVSFVPDVADAMIRVAEHPDTWGRVWHVPNAPAVTQRELAAMVAAELGVPARVKTMSPWLLRLAGLVIKPAGEMVELIPEFESDYLVDSSAFTERFGVEATPLAEAVARTVGTGASTEAVG